MYIIKQITCSSCAAWRIAVSLSLLPNFSSFWRYFRPGLNLPHGPVLWWSGTKPFLFTTEVIAPNSLLNWPLTSNERVQHDSSLKKTVTKFYIIQVQIKDQLCFCMHDIGALAWRNWDRLNRSTYKFLCCSARAELGSYWCLLIWLCPSAPER